MTLPQLLSMGLIWTITMYCINCLIAKRLVVINPVKATYYVITMSMLGVIGEIIIDSIYYHINDKPLWQYQIYPIHESYTSVYSVFIWGLVGFHLYLFHDTLEKMKITSINILALVFCVEAIILEILFNLSFMMMYQKFVYYYLPNDLWHLSSFQTLPLYLIAGYISIFTLKRFIVAPKKYSVIFLLLTAVVIGIEIV